MLIKNIYKEFIEFTPSLFNYIKDRSIFYIALLVTLLFYYPSLLNKSYDAGFLYGGDVLGFYWPSLIKVQHLISNFQFTGIDFSQFNGSADFFLTANFFGVNPFFVLIFIVTSPFNLNNRDVGQILVIVLMATSFLACYYSIKLGCIVYKFNKYQSVFLGIGYAFSIYFVSSLGEPQFNFCATLIPWAIYQILHYVQNQKTQNLIYAIFPIIGILLGGYIPFGLACLLLALALVALQLYVSSGNFIEALTKSIFPPFIASIIVLPYMYSAYVFLKNSPSANTANIFYSAFQLSELPQSILRLFSINYPISGPFYEFTVYWGIVPCLILLVGIFCSRLDQKLSLNEISIIKSSIVIYGLTVLSIYGTFSVVSSLVYYFIPQIGTMHIYQRFLMPANLCFFLITTIFLKLVIENKSVVGLRISLAFIGMLIVYFSISLSTQSEAVKIIGLNNYIIFELILAIIFLISLLIPGYKFQYIVAITLIALPIGNRMYEFSRGGNTYSEKIKIAPMALDEQIQKNFVDYLNKRFPNKKIIKYADLTPLWSKSGIESFPKTFPYFVLKEINLSSYGGFNFYLSSQKDYMDIMPVRGSYELQPNWQYLKNTDVDFLIVSRSQLNTYYLKNLLQGINPSDFYNLSGDLYAVPVDEVFGGETAKYSNGFFRINSGLYSEDASAVNIAKNKPTKQSGEAYGASSTRAVDGNTNGNHFSGSVSHSESNPNAWINIDLESSYLINKIKVWNRTDCCPERLANFWVFISNTPFNDNFNAEQTRGQKGVYSYLNLNANPFAVINIPETVNGRYLRIQLNGEDSNSKILSLAEVEVFTADKSTLAMKNAKEVENNEFKNFKTNYINHLKFDLDNDIPVNLQYLFWKNNNLHFYLNGEKLQSLINEKGIFVFNAAPGKNIIEVKYRNFPLNVFWLFYGLYFLLLISFIIKDFFDKRKFS
jgi:hypothetical protein